MNRENLAQVDAMPKVAKQPDVELMTITPDAENYRYTEMAARCKKLYHGTAMPGLVGR